MGIMFLILEHRGRTYKMDDLLIIMWLSVGVILAIKIIQLMNQGLALKTLQLKKEGKL